MANFVNHSRFVRPDDHHSVSYIKQDEIGTVLARALADLYITKPKNQLHFLGHWLLSHANSIKKKKEESDKEERREYLKERHSKSIQDLNEKEEKKIRELEIKKEKEDELKNRIKNSLDVDDFLDEVIEYLKNETQSAASYIGKLEKVKKPITLLDNERAHIDEDAPLVLRYISASKNSQSMIGKILTEQEGEATYSVWKEEEPPEDAEESPEKDLKKDKIKTISVEDVVTDPRIKFFDVPKLGAYFAVPLTYKSCLLESSFDSGLEDTIECRKLRAAQEEEKQKSEHASNKEEEEEKVYEEIVEAPYKVHEVKLVVAADTMGQDRVFTENQKEFIINWVEFLKIEWERAENHSLKHDIEHHLAQNLKFQQYLTEKQTEWLEQEKVNVEEHIKTLEPTLHEDIKYIEGQSVIFELLRERLLNLLPDLYEYTHYKVVKYAKVFQIAFYLSNIDREEIVEPKTNMISWKKSKKFLNDHFKEFITHLHPRGPKAHKPPVYSKTMKLEKDLLSIPIEDLQLYSLPLSILYKFLELYFKIRILDVTYRRHEYNTKVEEREAAIKASEDLAERRKRFIEEAKENFDKELEALDEEAEKPVFDEAKLLQEFDETDSNKAIEIPLEIIPDQDGDIDWEETS